MFVNLNAGHASVNVNARVLILTAALTMFVNSKQYASLVPLKYRRSRLTTIGLPIMQIMRV